MAWTITETVESYSVNIKDASECVDVVLTCTSDANGTDYDITSDTMMKIRGGYLYEMKVSPGSGADAPSAAFDIDIEDSDDAHILDTDSNSESAITFHDCAKTIGHYPIVKKQISFVPATLGDGNKATVTLSILK